MAEQRSEGDGGQKLAAFIDAAVFQDDNYYGIVLEITRFCAPLSKLDSKHVLQRNRCPQETQMMKSIHIRGMRIELCERTIG